MFKKIIKKLLKPIVTEIIKEYFNHRTEKTLTIIDTFAKPQGKIDAWDAIFKFDSKYMSIDVHIYYKNGVEGKIEEKFQDIKDMYQYIKDRKMEVLLEDDEIYAFSDASIYASYDYKGNKQGHFTSITPSKNNKSNFYKVNDFIRKKIEEHPQFLI